MSNAEDTIAESRERQARWEATPLRERLEPVRALQRSLGANPISWASAITPPQERTVAESLAGEILPLADACRWLGKHAAGTLRPRREGRGFGSVSVAVNRKPHGVVLVIGASNYPLLLLAVPAVQAVVAGNVVLLKPPPGGEAVAEELHAILSEGPGLGTTRLLDSSADAAQAAIAAGVDHVVLTGSAETGAAVARQAADTLTPCTLECSGADAVVVLPAADLTRVADAVAWGLRFNSGATCIGPKRLIAGPDQIDQLGRLLAERLAQAEPRGLSARSAQDAQRLVEEARSQGCQVVSPAGFAAEHLRSACVAGRLPPIVLAAGEARPALLDADLFAPVVTLLPAGTVEERIAAANDCPYALGASVFGPAAAAATVARRLRAGCVTINDLIAPTGDARVPFGGAGRSGYGVTRGREGLLAMTRPQAVARRHGGWLPHLDEPTPALDDLLAGTIQMQHASGLRRKWVGLRRMVAGAMAHKRLSGLTTESTETPEKEKRFRADD